MNTVIVYESMYGNTRLIAEAIARGLGPQSDAMVLPVARARPELLDGADLLVVGGPTHAHGMSRAATRKAAAETARKPGSGLAMEPGAEGPGLREWLARMGRVTVTAAAFDTRIEGPAVLTGQASKGIARLLRQHGLTMAAQPESFLVTRANQLRGGEEDRARAWSRRLASKITAMNADAVGGR